MKISLRDLFWLTLIIGIGVSWGVERQRIQLAFANARPFRLRLQPSGGGLTTLINEFESSEALRELSNEQLAEYLPIATGHHIYTAYLLEMSRRRMSTELQRNYAIIKQSPSAELPDPNLPPNTPSTKWDNREWLTALRRAEGNPDPIKIDIQCLGADPERKLAASSFLIPQITNVDAGREPFYVEDGYFSQERWQFRLTNSRGEDVPRLERHFSDYGALPVRNASLWTDCCGGSPGPPRLFGPTTGWSLHSGATV